MIRKRHIIIVLLIITSLSSVLAILELTGPVSELFPLPNPTYDVSCEVDIVNSFLANPSIKSVDCTVQKSSLFTISEFFLDSGNVIMQAQGKIASATYEVGETGFLSLQGETKKVLRINKLQPGETVVTLKLLDENSVLIDVESVTLNIGG